MMLKQKSLSNYRKLRQNQERVMD